MMLVRYGCAIPVPRVSNVLKLNQRRWLFMVSRGSFMLIHGARMGCECVSTMIGIIYYHRGGSMKLTPSHIILVGKKNKILNWLYYCDIAWFK